MLIATRPRADPRLPAPPSARWGALLCAAGAITLAVLLWLALPHDSLRWLLDESGPVERLAEWLYFALAGAFALLAPVWLGLRTRVALVVVMLGFGAREMDLHKAWTEVSVLKLGFYAGPASWPSKVVAASMLLAVAAALLLLVRQHAGALWRAWLGRLPVAMPVVVFLGAMLLSKVLDRAPAILMLDLGMPLSAGTVLLMNAIEETLELSLPLIVATGWWQQRRRDPRADAAAVGMSEVARS